MREINELQGPGYEYVYFKQFDKPQQPFNKIKKKCNASLSLEYLGYCR